MGLHGEILPAAAHAALHLVGDQQRAVPLCRFTQCEQELGRQVVGACDTLDGLDDHRRDVGPDHRSGSHAVIARDKIDVERRVRKRIPFPARPPGGP